MDDGCIVIRKGRDDVCDDFRCRHLLIVLDDGREVHEGEALLVVTDV